jgi:hypothetical protein
MLPIIALQKATNEFEDLLTLVEEINHSSSSFLFFFFFFFFFVYIYDMNLLRQSQFVYPSLWDKLQIRAKRSPLHGLSKILTLLASFILRNCLHSKGF